MAANNTVTTLVSFPGAEPTGVALDAAGNVYIAGGYNIGITMWAAASSNIITLVSSAQTTVGIGLAVDGSGNVYFPNAANNIEIDEWTAANGNVATLAASGLYEPVSVAVDGSGNIYIADWGSNVIEELPYAFVDPTPKLEGLNAGTDTLPQVLPATQNLLPPFAPATDAPWLTITGITNGVVSFSVAANTGPPRTAHINLLGQPIAVTQVGPGPSVNLVALPPQGNGVFQFAFGDTQNASFTVLTSTNLSLPFAQWTVAGMASNIGPDLFEFTEPQATNDSQRFYTVRSP
jgi:hypothetical protein